MSERDHIFISYAWEDAALAEWLARKLMAGGYAVWIDRFKLLGGDVWPEDIDNAIKNRSFRMVHLLSRRSLTKENPSKERQLALTIGKSRQEKFLIPLNVDGIGPDELPWQLTDIQYIPFEDWVVGLKQLLETLEGVQCPRPWDEAGQELAVRSCFPLEAVKEEPERLYTNCYKVLHVPEVIQRWESAVPVRRRRADGIANSTWPCYPIDGNHALSFEPPPDDLLKECHFSNKGAACWTSVPDIDGVDSRNVAKSLVRKSMSCIATRRGLAFHAGGRYWCFTQESLDESGNLHFSCYTGKRTYVKARGERKILGDTVKYALAFQMVLRDDILDSLTFQAKVRLHLRDSNNVDIEAAKIPSRRRAITGKWWNHEWFLRQEAIVSFLAEEQDSFSWGTSEKTAVLFSANPFTSEVPFSLDDDYIDSLKTAGRSEEEIKQEMLDEELAEVDAP